MPPTTAAVEERPDYLLDDEMYEQEESGLGNLFRRFDDSQLTRFLWIAGDDILVNDRSPSRFWGLYKNETMPKRRLLPVRHARSLAAFEIPAIGGDAGRVGMKHLDQYEAETHVAEMEGSKNYSMRLTRPPRTVAYEIMAEYEASEYGPALFEHAQLMGDDKKDFVLKLYRAIVPYADPKRSPNRHWLGEDTLRPQTRKGVKFLGLVTGTFLDQWVTYLNDFAAENVRGANLSRYKPKTGSVEGTDDPLSEHDLALLMLSRMQEAAARAWSHQTAYLESSRDQIIGKRNGGKGKRWYDARDERYLLETGTLPLNLEEVAAASKAAEQNEMAIMRGIDKIVERMNPPVTQGDVAAQIQRQVEESLGGLLDKMSAEQLQAVLERKLRAQETQESPTVDSGVRREQTRQQRRQEELLARQAQDAAQDAAVVADALSAATDDEAIEPLDEGGDE